MSKCTGQTANGTRKSKSRSRSGGRGRCQRSKNLNTRCIKQGAGNVSRSRKQMVPKVFECVSAERTRKNDFDAMAAQRPERTRKTTEVTARKDEEKSTPYGEHKWRNIPNTRSTCHQLGRGSRQRAVAVSRLGANCRCAQRLHISQSNLHWRKPQIQPHWECKHHTAPRTLCPLGTRNISRAPDSV